MPIPIAFLGLGLMGTGMAGRLLEKGFSVSVYNRNVEKAEPLRALGAIVKSTPREAAAGAEAVISMVSDDNAARAIWSGDNGALAGIGPGTVLVESSTISPAWVRELSVAAGSRGCELLDAPVTGSKPQAAAGQLVFMVGGSEAALSKVQPMLLTMGRDAIHLGPSGSGAKMKLINNFLCGVQAVGFAEAMAAIESSGLDRTKAVEALTNRTPGSPIVKVIAARVLANDYSPNFVLNLMTKDMRYAIEEFGPAAGMEVATAAMKTMEQAIDQGLGEKDFSSVAGLFRRDTKGSS
jgi:3-hydroxyisobutyrate dehydrogenase